MPAPRGIPRTADLGNKLWPFPLEHVPDRPFGQFRLAMGLGVADAFVQQPGIQLVEDFEPQPRREEAVYAQPGSRPALSSNGRT
jgi:hypothetical protein